MALTMNYSKLKLTHVKDDLFLLYFFVCFLTDYSYLPLICSRCKRATKGTKESSCPEKNGILKETVVEWGSDTLRSPNTPTRRKIHGAIQVRISLIGQLHSWS